MSLVTCKSKNWQCRLGQSADRMAYIKNSGFMSDLTITFPGYKRVLKVHRLVLAASSPVFEAMLHGPLAKEDTLSLSDDSPEAFDWLLKYIYYDKMDLPFVEMAIQVYILAHKYQLDALCKKCSVYLINEVDGWSFPWVFDIALLLEDEELLRRCDEVLLTSSEEVLNSKYFRLLRSSSLKQLLSHPRLNVPSEGKVFSAIVSWGIAQLNAVEDEASRSEQKDIIKKFLVPKVHEDDSDSDEKICDMNKIKTELEATEKNHREVQESELRQVVWEFLPLVRFLAMTSDEFRKYVMLSDILSDDESMAIQQRIEGVQSTVLPDFVSVHATKTRERIIKSCLLCNDSFTNGENLKFQFYTEFTITMLEIFKTSKPIFIVSISCDPSPCEGELCLQDSLCKEIGKGTWRGSTCKFKRPVYLEADQIYKVTLTFQNSFHSQNFRKICITHEGVTFAGATRCNARTVIEYFLANDKPAESL